MILLEKIYNQSSITTQQKRDLKYIVKQLKGQKSKLVNGGMSFTIKNRVFELTHNPIIIRHKDHHTMIADISDNSIQILTNFIHLELLV
jgi:hypothetical protein